MAEQNFALQAKDSAANMCSLVPQAAAEEILGAKLSGPPQPGEAKTAAGLRSCTYKTPMKGNPQLTSTYELDLWNWRDGAVEFTQDQYTFGGAMHAMRKQFTGDTTAPKDTAQSPVGPWEGIGPSNGMGWEAVKGPYMVKSSSMGDKKATLDLLAKALTALSSPH